MKRKRNLIILLVIVLLTIFLSSYLIENCDYYFHEERLKALAIQIKEIGLFNYPYYINFTTFNNMGYPTSLFYPDIFLIIPAIFLNFNINIKIVYTFTILISFCLILYSSYLSYIYYYNNKCRGLYYAIIYTFTNFILFEIIERSALGTNFAYIFLPWIVLSFIDIINNQNKKYSYLILGISMSLLIMSHCLTSVIVFLGLFLYLILNIKNVFNNKKIILKLFFSVLICLLLCGYYIFPMLEQLSYQKLYFVTNSLNQMSYSYIRLINIIFPNYSWNQMIPKSFIFCNDSSKDLIVRTSSIPSMFIIVIILLGLLILTYKKKKINSTEIKMFVIVLLGILFSFTNILSYFDIFNFMQFPWRMLIWMVMFLPLLFINNDNLSNYNYIISLFSIVYSIFYLIIFIFAFYDSDNSLKSIGQGDYLPAEIPSLKYQYNNSFITSKVSKNGYIITIDYDGNLENIELPVVYYKGYKLYDSDNLEIQFDKGKNGLIQINKNYKIIKVKYVGTLIQKITKYISLISWILILGFIIIKKKKRTSH